MNHNTARQEVLGLITGRSVASIRHMQAHGYAPWNDAEFEPGKHRRYSAQHALALLLAEILTKQGVSNEDASEFVQAHCSHATRFLDRVERGETGEQEFVAAFYSAEEDSLTGLRWTKLVNAGGTAEEVLASVASTLARVGLTRETRNGRTTERTIAGPRVSVASIPEAYRLLKQRAEAEGYGIDGRRIYKLEQGEQ
jgi:DNA-binding transcriptional MerR regulator